MAAPGRADPARRRARVARRASAHRPHARRVHAVGRLAARHRRSRSASARASSTSTTRSPSRPAIGALVGIGAGMLWKRRHDVAARAVLAVVVAVTAIWAFVLLDRTPDWNPWLRGPLLIAGLAVACVLLAAHLVHGRALARRSRSRRIGVILAAPAAYTLTTVTTPHTGAIPTAGPAGASTMGFGGPGGGGRWRPRRRSAGSCPGDGGQVPGGAGRRPAVGSRCAAVPAACSTGATPERRAHRAARAGRRLVHLGRGDHRRQPGGRLPARHRRAGDGDRRLQRHRPDADARRSSSSTCARARSTTSSAAAAFGGGGGRPGGGGTASTSSAISTWVSEQLHQPDRRRRDRLRPHADDLAASRDVLSGDAAAPGAPRRPRRDRPASPRAVGRLRRVGRAARVPT